MAKQLLKKYPKYQKKVFDSFMSGDETWIHFYEPKWKVDNRRWALKHAEQSQTAKKVLTLVLLNLDIPCLCKQCTCRSRSVGF